MDKKLEEISNSLGVPPAEILEAFESRVWWEHTGPLLLLIIIAALIRIVIKAFSVRQKADSFSETTGCEMTIVMGTIFAIALSGVFASVAHNALLATASPKAYAIETLLDLL